ncbi:hypothetical protein QWJ34_12250 [Saccharibacillus sp. CPCC 101409]|uniref:hypothetical protein n=1 Tax=Saccharibacillus sp. CPCC 101409 TaxID=3058041 RepID=UPI002672E1C3|nr:hypothetical protein [Saccharibacillus sp. CPCC 101409]MDO3410534.1 hypothetical protein [Saccharibacillus sp. CPCC 101409]
MAIIGILGTIHHPPLREQYNLPLSLYREVIEEFAPDLICGEVHPLSWQRYLEHPGDKGYWGEPASEYWELIFPLCEERGIGFVPIDWFELDVLQQFDTFAGIPEKRRTELERRDDEWFAEQLGTYAAGRIPFNSQAFDDATRRKYDWRAGINPEGQNVNWTARNQIMIQRVKNTYRDHPGKRILCVVGADHNYLFAEALGKEPVELVYPLR